MQRNVGGSLGFRRIVVLVASGAVSRVKFPGRIHTEPESGAREKIEEEPRRTRARGGMILIRSAIPLNPSGIAVAEGAPRGSNFEETLSRTPDLEQRHPNAKGATVPLRYIFGDEDLDPAFL